jgi:hypothetical protein
MQDAIEKNQALHHEALQDGVITLNVCKWSDHLLKAIALIGIVGLT